MLALSARIQPLLRGHKYALFIFQRAVLWLVLFIVGEGFEDSPDGLDFILCFVCLLPGFVYLFTELNQNPKPSIYCFRSFRWFWYAEFSSKPAIFCVVPFFYSRICCVNTDYIFIIVPDGADI